LRLKRPNKYRSWGCSSIKQTGPKK